MQPKASFKCQQPVLRSNLLAIASYMGHRTGVWSSAPRFLILVLSSGFSVLLWRQKNWILEAKNLLDSAGGKKCFDFFWTFYISSISANPIGARRGPSGVAATGPGEGEEEAGRGREETEGGKSHFVAEGRERGCVKAMFCKFRLKFS